MNPRCDTPGADWGTDPRLEALRLADVAHGQALEAAAAAGRARAQAVLDCRAAGMTTRAIGAALGISHVRVQALERDARAAGLSPTPGLSRRRDTPGAGSSHLSVVPTSELSRLLEASARPQPAPVVVYQGGFGDPCLREGCPAPKMEGSRFCAGHAFN